MIKFTVNMTILKGMIEKVMTVVDKKSSLSQLWRVYFQIDKKGTLSIVGTNMEHFVEINTDFVFNSSPGVIGIDEKDINIITKMNGEITFMETTENPDKKRTVLIKNGKKSIEFVGYDNMNIFLPSMDDTETEYVEAKESWLYETLVNLYEFTETSKENSNKMLFCINFNMDEKQVEASEGHMICTRKMKEDYIVHNGSVLLHNIAINPLKKILDKKSKKIVTVSMDGKYVKVYGEDFTYVQRKTDVKYFNVKRMMNSEWRYKFNAARKDMLSVMKYDSDLIKASKEKKYDVEKPVAFVVDVNEFYVCCNTGRYKTADLIDTKELVWNKGIITFNPSYFVKAMNIVDVDMPLFYGYGSKNPCFIEGNEYKFLILPVFVNGPTEYDYLENIKKQKMAV